MFSGLCHFLRGAIMVYVSILKNLLVCLKKPSASYNYLLMSASGHVFCISLFAYCGTHFSVKRSSVKLVFSVLPAVVICQSEGSRSFSDRQAEASQDWTTTEVNVLPCKTNEMF